MLEAGVPAPDFTLLDQHRQPVQLVARRGRWVVLWWYPKASTPG